MPRQTSNGEDQIDKLLFFFNGFLFGGCLYVFFFCFLSFLFSVLLVLMSFYVFVTGFSWSYIVLIIVEFLLFFGGVLSCFLVFFSCFVCFVYVVCW